jgi:lipopolysaccharide/colanic/teichoic acid biosynthesis glycosyltransferase
MHTHHLHPRLGGRPDVVLITPDTFHVSAARRALDVVGACLLLLVALPVLAVAALAVRLEDGGPVFFRQQRVGEGGRPFSLLKLRTMRSGSPGPDVTASGDDRITRVGRILRRTSVDELPQVLHVLTGRMTLVGPRPESVALAVRYPRSCRIVLTARPGLTGPSQLAYRERSAAPPPGWDDVDAWYLQRMVPLRVEADLEYLTHPTVRRTVGWVWRTGLFVLGLADHQRVPDTAGLGPGLT